MPLSASKIQALKKPISFDYLGESVEIAYYPAALNGPALTRIQDIYQRMDAAQSNPDMTEAEADALMLECGAWVSGTLAAWDYVEDDPALGEVGQPVPLTPERIVFELKRFPDFITACVSEVGRDYNAGKTNGASSSAPSAATSLRTGKSALKKASRKR